MKILLIILLSLLGLIAFLLLLMCFAVHIYVSYDDELKVKIRYLFISKTLFPTKEKKPKKKPAEPKKRRAEPKEPKPKKENVILDEIKSILDDEGILGLIDYIKSVLSAAAQAFRDIIKAIVIKKLELIIVVAGEDAAETATNYGKICAGVYPAYAVLASFIKVKKNRIVIEPNFLLDENKLSIKLNAYFRPIKVLWIGLKFFIKFIFITKIGGSGELDDENLSQKNKIESK